MILWNGEYCQWPCCYVGSWSFLQKNVVTFSQILDAHKSQYSPKDVRASWLIYSDLAVFLLVMTLVL